MITLKLCVFSWFVRNDRLTGGFCQTPTIWTVYYSFLSELGECAAAEVAESDSSLYIQRETRLQAVCTAAGFMEDF